MGNMTGLGLHLIFVSIFLVATTHTCLGGGNVSVVCSRKERLTLLKFKQSVKDDFGMLSSWVGNNCCLWEGIHCDSLTGAVESLRLRGDGGPFPYAEGYLAGDEVNSSLAKLRHLKYLDLSGNDFGGSQIPEFIGSFTQLSYLNLSYVGFQGIIPHHIGNLSNLKVLDLGFNSFKGPFPYSFQNMRSLAFLDLSGFNLSLSLNFVNLLNMIPSLSKLHLSSCGLNKNFLSSPHINISTLSNIQHLDFSSNTIEGIFPYVFTNMSSLRFLDLSGNMLNSSVPIMPNLLELYLSGNKFEQIEDVGIWTRCNLKSLSASENSFTIEMTDSVQNVSKCSQYALEWLDLSRCLNGTIPDSLGRLTNLVYLDLSISSLTGPIPESLGRLRYLEELDLSYNELTGPIPTLLGDLSRLDLTFNMLNGSIPESFGNLTALTYLNLGSNRLTGPIPASLGRLVSLQTVSVSLNLLNGTIPVSIGQLSKLYWLDISYNNLEGAVSETHFANLSTLWYLDASSNTKLTFNVSHEWIAPFQLNTLKLGSCNFANGLPRWLRNQKELFKLVLSNATIAGSLPTWLQRMPTIPFLDLSHNKLSGSLKNLPNEENIYVAGGGEALLLVNNMFNESIPWSLCRRTDLALLDLSRNRLTGKIPKCLQNLQGLGTMIFSSNLLSGVIPKSIGHNHSSLHWLKLNDNNFIGELPQELGNLQDLVVLDLGENKLFGNIPQWVGEKLSNLMVLRLHSNNFTGEIPESLCKSSKLHILDVAYNNLTGIIPHCLRELNAMVKGAEKWYFGTSDPNENVFQVMKGVDLEYTTTWDIVFNLDLSSNKLVGEIPIELTVLSMLVGLNLSNNRLSGNIPDSIGNMTTLFSLDLSGNELMGMIPQSMAALTFLSHLNLSHNNLSGRIPTGRQLETLTDPSIYAGNKDLCGAPLPNDCSNHEDPTTAPKKKHKATEESMKVWWFYLDIMSGFATGFWGVIGVLLFKKQWRWKLFRFADETMDRIYVTVMVRVAKMKRGSHIDPLECK